MDKPQRLSMRVIDQPKNEGIAPMKNLLAEIAKRLVDYPDQVRVNEIDGGHTIVLELSVAKQDIGKSHWEKKAGI